MIITVVAIQKPVSEVEQCPLHQLLLTERRSLDATIARLASGVAPMYQPINARSHVASMIQSSICERRARGERLRPGELSRIEHAIGHLRDHEQASLLETLAGCRAGCRLRR
jgi:hypothetical protein